MTQPLLLPRLYSQCVWSEWAEEGQIGDGLFGYGATGTEDPRGNLNARGTPPNLPHPGLVYFGRFM
jgi:hypothetical protein